MADILSLRQADAGGHGPRNGQWRETRLLRLASGKAALRTPGNSGLLFPCSCPCSQLQRHGLPAPRTLCACRCWAPFVFKGTIAECILSSHDVKMFTPRGLLARDLGSKVSLEQRRREERTLPGREAWQECKAAVASRHGLFLG